MLGVLRLGVPLHSLADLPHLPPGDLLIATDDGKEYRIKDAFRYVEKSSMDLGDLGKRKSSRESAE